MKGITRNVILDLLPMYVAGEVCDDTRILVEEYLSRDTPDAESPALVPVFPDIDKDDSRFPFVGRFHLYKYGRHNPTRNALIGSQVEHGYQTLHRYLGKTRMTTVCSNKKDSGKEKNRGEPHCLFFHTNLD